MNALLLLTLAGVVELLGPGTRPAARNQQTDRADGTGQFVELVLYSAPGTTGASRLQLWTSKHDGTSYSRLRLQEKELAIPDPQRIAKELYDFPIANYSNPNAATAENRAAILSGDSTVRFLNVAALTIGRAIAIPANARQVALRPGNGELFTSHSGTLAQVSICDPVTERMVGTVPLRITPASVPVAMFFSVSGKTLFVIVRNPDSTTDRGYVFLIDPATRTQKAQISLGTNSPSSAVLSPDGSTIYIAGTSLNDLNTPEPSMVYFDILTNTASVAALGLTIAPGQIVIHPDGTKIYWTFPTTYGLDEFNIQLRRVTRRINLPRLIVPQNLEFTPIGDILTIRDAQGQLATHLDPESGTILDAQPIPVGPGVTLLR